MTLNNDNKKLMIAMAKVIVSFVSKVLIVTLPFNNVLPYYGEKKKIIKL